MLLLDEATSALDGPSEEAIREALARLMQNRTVIAVAHRITTVRQFDRILVIGSGRLLQDGSPSDLAAGAVTARSRAAASLAPGGVMVPHRSAHATCGRQAMTPRVRARTCGGARHVASGLVAGSAGIGGDLDRRAVVGGT